MSDAKGKEGEEEFSVVIVGAGSGGLTAADFAAHLGAKTALVEANRIGGDCTWTGCVPSKALIKAAKVAHTVRTSSKYGIEGVPDPSQVRADMQKVHDHVHGAIKKVYEQESAEEWEKRGIRVFMGRGEFLDEHRLRICNQDGTEVVIRGQRFVVCTGARPAIPDAVKDSGVDYLTYETVFDVKELPPSLLVVGGGPIGSELGQAFARLGSKVTVLSRHLLKKKDEDARDVIAKVFEAEGITHVAARLKSIARNEDGTVTVTADDGTAITVARVLVASGRVPVVDTLGLEAARVAFNNKDGIDTNAYLQTSRRHIYGAGDCIGSEQFTHYAGWQAFMAVRNFILPSHSRAKTHLVPRCTFTDPEVASVGMSQEEFEEAYGDKGRVFVWRLNKVDRAVTEAEEDKGFYKIMYTRSDNKIRGACFVCQRAGELINEVTLCMANDIKVTDLGRAMHAYPSFGIALQQMCAEVAVDGLLTGLTGRVLNWLKRV